MATMEKQVVAQERVVYVPRPANANLKQAAQFAGVSTKTILNWMDRGVLKPVYLDKRRFFRWSELERIAKNGVQSRSVKKKKPEEVASPASVEQEK